MNLMCDDQDKARLNRERVKQGVGNDYYDQQARCLAQWTEDKPPENLVLGELPVVGLKQIRLDRREGDN